MSMKLLKDITVYAIKVDYYMYDPEIEAEYLEPVYLSIDTEKQDENGNPMNLITFRDSITPNLRIFDTLKEANDYKLRKCSNSHSFENARIVKVKYDHKEEVWKEY